MGWFWNEVTEAKKMRDESKLAKALSIVCFAMGCLSPLLSKSVPDVQTNTMLTVMLFTLGLMLAIKGMYWDMKAYIAERLV